MIVLYERRCGVSKVKSVDASVCWAYVITPGAPCQKVVST